MLQEYIKKQQDKNQKGDFYTSSGIHVYHKEQFHCDDIELERAVAKYESIMPTHLLSEIEMIIVGWFEEFDERSLSALYKDGAIYISSFQDDNQELYEDLIHETFHSLESPSGLLLYSDEKIKEEFLRKRKYLHDIMWQKGFKIPLTVFMDVEYNQDLDLFLYEQVGYDKLSSLVMGMFIDPYAVTSLSEYAATGFTEYYTNSDHKYLQKVSPALYEKLILLQKEETLDNQY